MEIVSDADGVVAVTTVPVPGAGEVSGMAAIGGPPLSVGCLQAVGLDKIHDDDAGGLVPLWWWRVGIHPDPVAGHAGDDGTDVEERCPNALRDRPGRGGVPADGVHDPGGGPDPTEPVSCVVGVLGRPVDGGINQGVRRLCASWYYA